MKLAVFLGLMLAGCAATEGTEVTAQEQAELGTNTCTSGGGVCRKGCRVNEEVSDTLECGHDQGCCVPAQQNFVTCESVGGTCRKSQCRSNEALSFDFECGTDAACCVPK